MTKNNINCTLTDAELSAKADQWIDELIASGGKSFTMQVPARPNKDTDLIFAELNNRFKQKMAEYEQLKECYDKMEAALEWIKTYGPDRSEIGRAFIDKALGEAKEVENGK